MRCSLGQVEEHHEADKSFQNFPNMGMRWDLGFWCFEFSTTHESQFNYSRVCSKPHLFHLTVDVCRYITKPTGRTMSFRSKRMIHSTVHPWSVKKAQEMIQFSLCGLSGWSALGSLIQGDHPKLNEEPDIFRRGEEDSTMLPTCQKEGQKNVTGKDTCSILFIFIFQKIYPSLGNSGREDKAFNNFKWNTSHPLPKKITQMWKWVDWNPDLDIWTMWRDLLK